VAIVKPTGALADSNFTEWCVREKGNGKFSIIDKLTSARDRAAFHPTEMEFNLDSHVV
jgi:hypothetical protein